MKILNKFYLLMLLILLSACGTIKTDSATSVESTEFYSWDTAPYITKKILAKVSVYASNEIGSIESNLYVFEAGSGQYKKYFVGKIAGNEGYEIALLPGEYVFRLLTMKSLFSEEVVRVTRLTVTGGENYSLKASRKELEITSSLVSSIKLKDKGSIYTEIGLKNRMRANVFFNNISNSKDQNQIVNVEVVANSTEPKFFLNGREITYQRKLKERTYQFNLRFEPGDNNLLVKIKGLDGVDMAKMYNYYIKTQKDIDAEKALALENERKKIEAERMRKIQLEKEAIAKKLEEERIAREGDDSPDDLSCKKYGLKPQTPGYSECRMRLDLSRKEGERTQAAISKAREDARRAELERRYEEVQRQNEIISNRESKCGFIKSQEYFRPTQDSFFEVVNRANSAYDNCMAGVPQINTTCTKDFYGKINCTSR